jgi:Fe-S oxidoreductase
MWKEEERGDGRVSVNRLAEAEDTGLKVLGVSCPFCMIMLTDALNTTGSDMNIRDVVEIVADHVLEDHGS